MRLAVMMCLLMFVCGCEADKSDILPPVVLATPLDLDPTEKHDLTGWWSDGKQMLRLDEPSGLGSYARFADMNRYREPIERGRWRQTSYDTLWLESYRAIEREPTRVGVAKIDGRLALRVPGTRAMFALDGPPLVLEDRLLGKWIGAKSELTLDEAMRYSLKAVRDKHAGSTALTGHSGRWSVREKTIVLEPDAPGLEPIELAVKEHEGAISLTGTGGELRRPEQKTAAEK